MAKVKLSWQDHLHKFEDGLYIEQEVIDASLTTLATNIISFAMLAGTISMAAVPAIFTGFSVYKLAGVSWPVVAVTAGWAAGIGLESVGMVASHVALKLYRSWRNAKSTGLELGIALALMAVYIVAVATIVGFVDGLAWTLKAVGMASPLLATVLYVARGLYLDVRNRETEERLYKRADEARAEEERLRRDAGELISRQAQREREEREAEWQAKVEFDRLAEEAELRRLRTKQAHDLKMRELELKYQQVNSRPDGRTEPVQIGRVNGRGSNKEHILDDLLVFLSNNPHASLSEIGREFGRSKSTAENYTNELINAGKLKRNGHGWEIMNGGNNA